jgi:hypothetical protein
MRSVLLASALALGACGPRDVVVAFVPPGGEPLPVGRPCVDDAECAPVDFCERLGCGELSGRCAARATLCGEDFSPVCGCDGVTYFNDCVRRQQGATAATPGECRAGATCSATTPCLGGASCARLVRSCGEDPSTGRCWSVPRACPRVGAFQACAGGACLDLCTAVRAEATASPCP